MTPRRAEPSLGRLLGLAVVVGTLGAGAAIAVRGGLTWGIRLLYGARDVVAGLGAQPMWIRIVAPALGGLAAGSLVSLLLRRGSQGVADVMEAVALGRGRPSLRAAAAQAAGTVAAGLGGGSIGREGPLIQLGAGVGQTIATHGTTSHRAHRALVAAGTAAGFAAAYNTPIAAVLFVLEVVIGTVALDLILPVLVATAVGTVLTRAVLGGVPIYGARAFTLVSPAELVAFGVLGTATAFALVGFMKLLAFGETAFQRLHLPRPLRACLGGLGVGLILVGMPEVAGNGFEPIRAILDGKLAIATLFVLVFAKAVATTSSVTSGSPGGVFTPTMVIGATLGAACGGLVERIAPAGVGIVPGGYALVGMAAAIAATTHAPLMATVMAFELSGDYDIVLPLLLATGISTWLARRLQRDSIYTAELRRRGIPWEGSAAERLAKTTRARELLEPDPPTISASAALHDAMFRMAEIRGRLLYVVDEGPLRAISLTTAKQLWAACLRGERMPEQTAGDIASPIATVDPDDSLLAIGEKLWRVDWGELPVVDPAAPQRPLGTISRRGLLGALDRELLQRDVLATRIVSLGDRIDTADYIELPDRHRIRDIAAPDWLVGKMLDVTALRSRLGIILVAVRRAAPGDSPPRWLDADEAHTLAPGDRLLVIATDDELLELHAVHRVQ